MIREPLRSLHIAPVGAAATARHYLRDLVYGGIDGVITTFAVVAGVRGGEFAAGVAIVIGVANLCADGLSMAVGNFLSIRSNEGARRAGGSPGKKASLCAMAWRRSRRSSRPVRCRWCRFSSA